MVRPNHLESTTIRISNVVHPALVMLCHLLREVAHVEMLVATFVEFLAVDEVDLSTARFL